MTSAILGSTLFFIDWVSAVLPFKTLGVPLGFTPLDSDAQRVMSALFTTGAIEPTKPRWGYAMAWRSRVTGIVLQYHPLREDMGLNVVMTGKTLELYSWQKALDRLMNKGARFTRLDLSMDVEDSDFDLEALYRQWERGETNTRASRASRVTSDKGETFYVGARTSDKFLRVYDKGAQMEGVAGQRYRIELECKGKAANFVANNLLGMGADAARRVIPAYFDAPGHGGWERAMRSSEPAVCIPSEKKRPDTEAWLMGLVADSMALMEKVNPGFLDLFYDEVVSKL